MKSIFVLMAHMYMFVGLSQLSTCSYAMRKKKESTMEASKEGFVLFYVFSFPPAVYVGPLNLIASIPGPSILTLAILIKIHTLGQHICRVLFPHLNKSTRQPAY